MPRLPARTPPLPTLSPALLALLAACTGGGDVAAPDLLGISPAVGPTTGGTAFTLTGTDLQDGATVTIGGVEATDLVFGSSTSFTAVSPAGVGVVDVVLVNPDGQEDTLAAAFTYVAPPSVTAVVPAQGGTAGGTTIRVTGAGFASGATVTVDGAAATDVTIVDDATITCVTPPGAVGDADVVVHTDGGPSVAGTFAYAAAPTLAIEDNGAGVLRWADALARGDAAPDSALNTRTTSPASSAPVDLAVDEATGTMFVVNNQSPFAGALLAFDVDATGDDAPLRVVSRPVEGTDLTRLSQPIRVARDGDRLIVASYATGEIAWFDATADGNVAPEAAFTDFGGVTGLVLDAAHDQLIVANGNGPYVKVYPATFSGETNTPVRTIAGAATTLGGFGYVVDVALVNDELYVLGTAGLAVFDAAADGDVPPKRTITGPAFDNSQALAYNRATNELYVVNRGTGSTPQRPSLVVFPWDAEGAATPTRTLTGGLVDAIGVTLY